MAVKTNYHKLFGLKFGEERYPAPVLSIQKILKWVIMEPVMVELYR